MAVAAGNAHGPEQGKRSARAAVIRGEKDIDLADEVGMYGLEGLGYVVTGTYLVAFAKTISDIPNIASFSWILVGVAAAPSCVVWSMLASKWGKKRTLSAAMLLQSIGIAIVLIPSTATLCSRRAPVGRRSWASRRRCPSVMPRIYPRDDRKIIGLLTTCFGLGQIIGPLAAGLLISGNGSYLVALVGAAIIVLLGAISLPLGIGRRTI